MDVVKIIKETAQLRGLSEKTIRTYTYIVDKFLRTYRKDPHQVTQNEIKTHLLRLLQSGRSSNTVNVQLNALKFFFEQGLRRKLTIDLRFSKVPKRLPEFLTQEEVVHFFDCLKNKKHKLMVNLLYSAGLRVSELTNLKVKDLQINENYGWVRQGKGNKDRPFIIAEKLKTELELWINKLQLEFEDYLFPSNRREKISVSSLQKIIKHAAKMAGIPKNVHPHTLRHSFATHLIENGYCVTDVQPLLGHAKLETTLVYTHLAKPKLLSIKSPFDKLS
ncbi:hypothetical protein COY27_05290 [Candidatus Woesearchaeota archaeon CG_4_10_14_0_2_um_filter_33_13]|nr:MAG: hypothetical protein COY27_05290 [Candidatus Woesearchaeota archaeon CG_4_10_14_0_2_um_filter_33_13]